ncbi:reverse transcriptase [Gossypium australe]|uniref:Reverse transcriptase n=1 Tax=Gossypium australe TaxID=47621 RepID=A0A5B6VMU7_9ROSI|nr:reverse transcriptase [Gossypium australe]
MALKLDMSKAYDRVECQFIREMMIRMRFPMLWIETITKCISSVSHLVIVNGKVGKSEGLSSLMRLAMGDGLLRGAKASRSANAKGAQALKGVLGEYERCLGQRINFDKSTIFYSNNTAKGDKQIVCGILGVRHSNDVERYLGLLNMVGCRKKAAFQVLKDHFKKKFES